jgi:hypothetical protein
MHVPAETALTETPSAPTYGGAKPRQLGSSAAPPFANGTSTPFVPAATIFASRAGVSHVGRGWSSVPMVPSASAALGPARSRSAASRPATVSRYHLHVPLSRM